MLVEYLDRLGIRDFRLLLNSVGDSKCRPEYVKVLRRALEDVKAQMCTDCQRRAHTNPLRVFDCKVEADQPIIAKLPAILDHLCLECRPAFAIVEGCEERILVRLGDALSVQRFGDHAAQGGLADSYGAFDRDVTRWFKQVRHGV